MTDYSLTTEEQKLKAALLERHAGKHDLGLNHDWPLTSLYEGLVSSDDAGDRWVQVGRLITTEIAAAGCLTPRAANAEVTAAWMTDNSPELVVPAGAWLEAFTGVGYLTDDPELKDPPEGVARLWRGATWDRRFGLAWTERRPLAMNFVDDLVARGEGGLLFQADVEAERVKARLTSRQEWEWVIDTTGLEVEIADDPR